MLDGAGRTKQNSHHCNQTFLLYKTITNNPLHFPAACLLEHTKAQCDGRPKSLVRVLTHRLSKHEILGIIFHFLGLFLYCLPHGAIMWFQRSVGEDTLKRLERSMISCEIKVLLRLHCLLWPFHTWVQGRPQRGSCKPRSSRRTELKGKEINSVIDAFALPSKGVYITTGQLIGKRPLSFKTMLSKQPTLSFMTERQGDLERETDPQVGRYYLYNLCKLC